MYLTVPDKRSAYLLYLSTLRFTGVKAGENDTDAVNMKQLKDKIANTASAQEIAYTANGATPIKKVKLSDGFNFKNGGMVDAIVEDSGVSCLFTQWISG